MGGDWRTADYQHFFKPIITTEKRVMRYKDFLNEGKKIITWKKLKEIMMILESHVDDEKFDVGSGVIYFSKLKLKFIEDDYSFPLIKKHIDSLFDKTISVIEDEELIEEYEILRRDLEIVSLLL